MLFRVGFKEIKDLLDLCKPWARKRVVMTIYKQDGGPGKVLP